MLERRQLITWAYVLAGVLGAWIIAAAPLIALGRPGPVPTPTHIVVATLAAMAAIIWAVVFATLVFRRLDEFQQAASKFAWYWGGSIGLAASLPVYAFIAAGGLHWLDPANFHLGGNLLRAFVIGYGLPVIFQLAGFLAARGWWQVAKR